MFCMLVSSVYITPAVIAANSQELVNAALESNGATISVSEGHEGDAWWWAEGAGNGNAPLKKMIDADSSGTFGITKYDTGMQNTPITLTVQFGSTYDISKVQLWGAGVGGFPAAFKLEAYTGTEWQEVGSYTDVESCQGGQYKEFTFDTVTCTGFRMVTVENRAIEEGKYGVCLGSFEIYGVEFTPELSNNIALASNGTVISTTHVNDWMTDAGYGMGNMIDGVGEGGNYGITAAEIDYQDVEMQIELRFAETYQIDKIRLLAHAAGGFPTDFTLSAYTGDGWKTLVTKTDYAVAEAGWHEFEFEAVDCSAVRLTSTENGKIDGEKYCVLLSEFEVYGTDTEAVVPTPPTEDAGDEEPPVQSTNIALATNGTTISTSHVNDWMTDAGYGIGNMIDGVGEGGNYGITAAETNYQNEEMQITLNFNATYKIDKIRLCAHAAGGFPRDFSIDAYTGEGWKTVVTKTDYIVVDAGWFEFEFEAVDCSAVRLTSTENGKIDGDKYCVLLSEFEVYGVTATSVVPAPPSDDGTDSGDETQDGDKGQTTTGVNVGLASNGTTAYTSHPDSWGESNGFGVTRLNDGSVSGQYFITSGDAGSENRQMKVTLNFKKAYKVDEVRLYAVNDGGFPVDFTLSVYTADGWKTVVTKRGYKATAGWQIFEFGAVDCSAVRLTSTKNGVTNNGKYSIYLHEFEVYGVAATSAVPVAPIEKAESTTPGSTGTGTTTPGATASENGFKYDMTKSLALYAPATARTDYASIGLGPANLTDGNIGTLYSCDLTKASKGTEEWVEINLLGNYAVDTVVLYARNNGWGFPIDFTISVFYDGEWTEVLKKTGYSSFFDPGVSEHVFTFPATIGNQIRISATNCQLAAGEYGLQLTEVAVYGERAVGDYVLPNVNLVNAGTVVTTSTSLEDYGFFRDYLIDGDVTTGYSSVQYSTPHNTEWIELDFKRIMNMGAIELKPSWNGGGFPVDFTVQVLVNDEWVTVVTVEDYEKPLNEAWQKFVFERQYEATKLRITVTELGEEYGQYCLKLNEIAVYPYATEGENVGAVEVVNNVRTEYNAAEEVGTKLDVPYVVLIVGGALILLAIAGGIVGYALMAKKIKRQMGK